MFDIDEQGFLLHFPLLIKSSPLVIYLVKSCDLLRPQILQVPFIILTSFLVLGLTFSYSTILFESLLCLPPTHHVLVIYIPKLFIIRRSTWFNIDLFLLSRFKKVKFKIYIYIHIILAKKLLSFVICSGEILSLLITSPKTSSTLNQVFFIISDFLSI